MIVTFFELITDLQYSRYQLFQVWIDQLKPFKATDGRVRSWQNFLELRAKQCWLKTFSFGTSQFGWIESVIFFCFFFVYLKMWVLKLMKPRKLEDCTKRTFWGKKDQTKTTRYFSSYNEYLITFFCCVYLLKSSCCVLTCKVHPPSTYNVDVT